MKTASWFLSPLLGVMLVYSFSQVPVTGPDSALMIHVESRYQQKGWEETRIGNPKSETLAVLTDYRSLDLWAATLLFLATALGLNLLFSPPPKAWELALPVLFLATGCLLVLGIGFLPLRKGSNFLDYEALAAWLASDRARPEGAFALLAACGLSFAGLLMFLNSLRRNGEKGAR